MYIEFITDNTYYRIPAKYAVCPMCYGKGKRVNPAIDGNGLTQEDFDELGDDFRHDYFSGAYDIRCNNCEGIRVVKVMDREQAEEDLLIKYDKYLDEEYMIAQEERMERMMGA